MHIELSYFLLSLNFPFFFFFIRGQIVTKISNLLLQENEDEQETEGKGCNI